MICLAMIARASDHDVIGRCLSSAKPLVDAYVIGVNGGPIGKVVEAAKQALPEIPGEVYASVWKNYSHNRNESLDRARAHATGADDYLLVLDADDLLEFPPNWTRPKLTYDLHPMMSRLGDYSYPSHCLFRARKPFRYVGAVHELALCKEAHTVSPEMLDVIYRRLGRELTPEQGKRKFREHARMLEEEMKSQRRSPDPRTVFYLAESYRAAGEPKRALRHYRQRMKMKNGFVEEVFLSQLYAARILIALKEEKEAVATYLDAITTDRERAPEVCHDLVRYYNDTKKHALGLLFGDAGILALDALEGKIPQKTFVDTSVYVWKLQLEWACSVWWCGDKTTAKAIFERLLLISPESQHDIIRENLALCK